MAGGNPKYRSRSTWTTEQAREMAAIGRKTQSAQAQLRRAAGLLASSSAAMGFLAILDEELRSWTSLLLAERARARRANLRWARDLVALIADLRKLQDAERARGPTPANGPSPTSAKLPTLAPLPSAVQQNLRPSPAPSPSTDPATKLDATSSTSSTDDLEPLTPEPIE